MFVILYCLKTLFFFFKQKTAYEMRISDWSSDVCSSDLLLHVAVPESGGEVAGVIATEGFRPAAIRARIALGQDARPCLQVRTRLERLFVGIEAVLVEVLPVDLCQAHGKVVAALFEHANSCQRFGQRFRLRSEEHTSELQSLMRISYAVFCLKI